MFTFFLTTAAAKKQQQRHQVTSGDNLSNVVALAMASVMQQQQPNQQFNASATAGSTGIYLYVFCTVTIVCGFVKFLKFMVLQVQ